MKKLINSVLCAAVGITLLALLSGLPACKQAGEKQQEKLLEKTLEQGSGQKADVDIDDQKITIESEGSKVEINTGEKQWPPDAPAVVPELKAGQITGTTISQSEQGKNWSIRYSGVGIEELDKFGAILKNNGFKIQTIKTGKGGMVSGEKGDIGVIFTVSDPVSTVIIMEQKPE